MTTERAGYTSDDQRHADRLIRRSARWASHLPREKLGSFAIDASLLAANDASWRLQLADNPDHDYKGWSAVAQHVEDEMERVETERMGMSVNSLTSIHDIDSIFDYARAEMFFWWAYSSYGVTYTLLEKAMDRVEPDVVERITLLNDIVALPEGLPYFEAGILDSAYIRKCIATGIDVSIAVELNSEVV